MENNADSNEELTAYGDSGITSADAPIPRWLLVTYFLLPIWGIVCLYIFWDGPTPWFDRGYWSQLQEVANTKHPYTPFTLPR